MATSWIRTSFPFALRKRYNIVKYFPTKFYTIPKCYTINHSRRCSFKVRLMLFLMLESFSETPTSLSINTGQIIKWCRPDPVKIRRTCMVNLVRHKAVYTFATYPIQRLKSRFVSTKVRTLLLNRLHTLHELSTHYMNYAHITWHMRTLHELLPQIWTLTNLISMGSINWAGMLHVYDAIADTHYIVNYKKTINAARRKDP